MTNHSHPAPQSPSKEEPEVAADDGREPVDQMDTYDDDQGERLENSDDDLNRVFKSESIVHSDDEELLNNG